MKSISIQKCCAMVFLIIFEILSLFNILVVLKHIGKFSGSKSVPILGESHKVWTADGIGASRRCNAQTYLCIDLISGYDCCISPNPEIRSGLQG